MEDRLYGDGWGGARPDKRMKYRMCVYVRLWRERERERGVRFDCCPVSKVSSSIRKKKRKKKKKIGFHENFTGIPLLAVDLILMRKGNRWMRKIYTRGVEFIAIVYTRWGRSEEFPVA